MSSTDLARGVITALVEAGVREVVLAPGSRNAPLSFAAYDAAAAGLLRLHSRVDERSAGFLALGLTKTGSRAAVMCTSGTAVANLHPAALEAAHSGVRLVVVTADRPERLYGTGANQTTDQHGILGPLVPGRALSGVGDVDVDGLWSAPGPLHWNVHLDEPLLPSAPWEVPAIEVRAEVQRPEPRIFESIDLGPRTVVVAGDDAGPPARVLAEAAGWPLLAEPSSGSRTGENAIRTYRLLLGSPLAERIERVVVCGHPTLSRPVSRLLARDDVEVVAGPVRGAWAERPFPVDRRFITRLHVGGLDGSGAASDPEWLAAWREADTEVGRRLDGFLAEQTALTPYAVAGAVARALPPGGQLVVGASNPIRDLDLMVPRYAVGARRKVLSNRGLAGIDGVVSTAIGAALGRDSTRDLALMGDVTFLHDSNGLVLGPDEPRPDLTIVVVNDDGGSIFATLEQGAAVHADRFERLFGTPHGVSIEALCAATRTAYTQATSLPALEQALAMPNGGIEVVEAVVGRTDRRALDERIRALAAW
ncbi:2-succinyl-5-enolpyruvyl-6-hydroxy-3-cyclohexene-1-carboxylate synthase [Nocardioides terrae]|uniref:2-succinyl-5-enolpyruvyl-6-hydroxy-3-cyclohexene-1-carboxylate synthase n=1 Tax=Nocardioides terrae TaxID=574651 RepID=A0A1I1HE59_9ACTN|nr:2-succinyl-5-enolpyruvyl-6-hydroxy-3-cyclohexene-1-carboxylic-acid synthase [Nocardioides terrae]SFC21995.1 2-succinyl-5-enolpyruvyl-6-hydroxy-3-cyclohexene-1-carboxylate synthase [Nocardioides terrae]